MRVAFPQQAPLALSPKPPSTERLRVNSSSLSDRFCSSSIIKLSTTGASSVYRAPCFTGSKRFFASLPPPCHLKRLREQSLIENLRLREVAYEEVHFLLPGAPLAEGHVPDLHDWLGRDRGCSSRYLPGKAQALFPTGAGGASFPARALEHVAPWMFSSEFPSCCLMCLSSVRDR